MFANTDAMALSLGRAPRRAEPPEPQKQLNDSDGEGAQVPKERAEEQHRGAVTQEG